jgi:outer membrane protein OmpA-like peptidoglycan-associated protein
MKSKALIAVMIAVMLAASAGAVEWNGKLGFGLRGPFVSPLMEGSNYDKFSGNEPFMMGWSGEFDVKFGIAKTLALGLTAGYSVTYDNPMAGKDQSYNEIWNKTDDAYTKLSGMLFSLEGYYYLLPEKNVQPFILVGIGADMWKMTTREPSLAFSMWPIDTEYNFMDLSAKFGAGINFWLGEHLTFDLQGKYSYGITNLSADDDTIYYGDMSEWKERAFTSYLQPSAGLTYYFGGRMDTDKDGVEDKADNCPDTPTGAIVDMNGCPLDTDNDGVYDGLDECANTPAGARVDVLGCPIDSDGDGVFDGLDKCPDTPVEAKVDASGCPIDTDKDGVPDYRDKEINTPAGAVVDADGVGIDTDGDGVYDGIDKCPTTPAGVTVDEFGCPVEVKKPVEKITLNIKYATGSYEPDAAAKKVLDDLAETMEAYVDYRIEIDGFTDNVGSEQSNQELSRKRAQAVKDYLVAKGIDASRMVAKGFGEDPKFAIGDNSTPEGRQQNRRVEIISTNQ